MRLVRIPGYNPFCRDRSGHSGGVLLYTRSHLTVKMLPCPHNGLEILPVVINCITVVYRPPRSQNSIFDSLCRFVASMNIHWCSHFLLLVILMSVVQLQHLLYHRVGSFIETCDLPQVVRYFTLRAPNDGTSLTDPVLTSSPSHNITGVQFFSSSSQLWSQWS